MINDIDQKRRALSYCVASGLVPFLEVRLRNEADVNETKADLTDLDVLGLGVVGCERPRRLIFDCKTLKGVSPINRGFWARGAMAYSGCDEAFVILKKQAPEGHRLAAKQMNVHLFDENLFDRYASAVSSDYVKNPAYLCDVGCWATWRRLPAAHTGLAALHQFVGESFPIEVNHVRALRSLVGLWHRAAGEFDPEKPPHVSLFYQCLSCLAICMSQIAGDLRNIFDPDSSAADFDRLCRRYVWEGKDNYELRNRLHRLTQLRAEKPESEIADFNLPGWKPFLELTRGFLEAPTSVSSCALPLKELAFRSLAVHDSLADAHLKRLLLKGRRTIQFCIALGAFARRGLGLPAGFEAIVKSDAEEVTATSSQPSLPLA